MPPLTYQDHELDEDGTVWVAFRDEATLDGLPVDLIFHIQPKILGELAKLREIWQADTNKLTGVIVALANGANPTALIDLFLDAYAEHLADQIDRIEGGFPAKAPMSQVDAWRAQGRPVRAQEESPAERLTKRLAP